MKRVRKRSSGASYRRQKKERNETDKKHSGALTKWLEYKSDTKPGPSAGSNSEDLYDDDVDVAASACCNVDMAKDSSSSRSSDRELDATKAEGDADDCELSSSSHSDYTVNRVSDLNESSVQSVSDDQEDIANIPTISDSVRIELVRRGSGPLQHRCGPFSSIKGRSLSERWFSKRLTNRQLVPRSWLLYSPSKEAAFCFCCVLFAHYNTKDYQKSSFGNVNRGFKSWQKLSPRIAQHEASVTHRAAFIEWKDFEKRLAGDKFIDEELQAQIRKEQQAWRDILLRILSTVKVLAEQNLAFRGHRESLDDDSSENPGNFLALLKYLGNFDTVLRQHLHKAALNPKTPSYLSHDIQNEFINLMANAVKKSIIQDIKAAKYYGMMFDTTPDMAHREEMSQIIRYVRICGPEVSIQESFLGFVEIHSKNADGLVESITDALKQNELQLKDCRAQSYDNAAVMAGRKAGVQQKLLEMNPHAVFIPCDNHSLNLVCVHAAETSSVVVTFFGTVQEVFVFFSGSTHRWEKLQKHVNVSVKRQCETRWSARQDAVYAIDSQLDGLVDALEELRDDPDENTKTRGDAGNILRNILNFQFLVLLPFWADLLQSVNRIQKRLQDPTMNVRDAANDIQWLKHTVSEKREKLMTFLDKGTAQCQEWDIAIECRTRRKKSMPGETADDAGLTRREEMSRVMCCVLDKVSSEMDERFKQLMNFNDKFSFWLDTKSLLASRDDRDQLKKMCMVCAVAYPNDISGIDLLAEIEDCRSLVHMHDVITVPETPIDLLRFIVSYGDNVFPNLCTILQILLTVGVSVASCERSFSKLKLIHSYLRSSMSQERLSNLAILSIEREVTDKINFDDIINDFASAKARRVHL